MATKYPDLFAALAIPFDSSEVKVRTQAGRQLAYITARSAMNRLDSVVGPENWFPAYFETEHGIKCRLSIRLPDGEWLAKEDGGAQAAMQEADNNEKSGYSDAFKRAAVTFGVARYLYRDGIPDFSGDGSTPEPAAPAKNYAPPAPSAPAPSSNGSAPADVQRCPRNGRGLFAMTKDLEGKHNTTYLKELNGWAKSQNLADRMVDWDEVTVQTAHLELCRLVAAHLASTGHAPAPASGAADLRNAIIAKVKEILSIVFRDQPVDNDQLKHKIDSTYSAMFGGEVMLGKFGTYADMYRLRELDKTLAMELEELKVDSGISF